MRLVRPIVAATARRNRGPLVAPPAPSPPATACTPRVRRSPIVAYRPLAAGPSAAARARGVARVEPVSLPSMAPAALRMAAMCTAHRQRPHGVAWAARQVSVARARTGGPAREPMGEAPHPARLTVAVTARRNRGPSVAPPAPSPPATACTPRVRRSPIVAYRPPAVGPSAAAKVRGVARVGPVSLPSMRCVARRMAEAVLPHLAPHRAAASEPPRASEARVPTRGPARAVMAARTRRARPTAAVLAGACLGPSVAPPVAPLPLRIPTVTANP
jgi:hypothetical protein